MQRTLVFLSHYSEEAALAELLKRRIEQRFLNLIEIFVSSDPQSIELGTRWLDRLVEALRASAAMLILCSEESVKLPWINFEAGAAWIRDIPVIPICHTNIRPVSLPLPLNMLQGIVASDPVDLERLYQRLAAALGPGTRTPEDDFEALASQIREFEIEYGLVSKARTHVGALISEIPDLQHLFVPDANHRTATGQLFEQSVQATRAHFQALQNLQLIEFSLKFTGMAVTTKTGGNTYNLQLRVLDRYYEIASQVLRSQ